MSVSQQVQQWNAQALHKLQAGFPRKALALLNQAVTVVLALKHSEAKLQLLSLTYTNLGCFYKKARETDLALHFFTQAMDCQEQAPHQADAVANTHIGLSSLFSGEGQHERALRHALKAVQVLKKHFVEAPRFVTVLVIAYHNAAVEYESLGMATEAAELYDTGYRLARERLGNKAALTETMRDKVLGRETRGVPRRWASPPRVSSQPRGSTRAGTRAGTRFTRLQEPCLVRTRLHTRARERRNDKQASM